MRAVVVVGVLALAASSCLPTGVVCVAGTDPCGSGCIDPLNDKRNCGGCGKACGANQECNAGSCGCQTGTTDCAGECVVLDSDAKHCGQCTVTCGDSQVCEQRTCKGECTIGTNLRCGSSCVTPATDPLNCGGCGIVCASGQVCRNAQCTYDVVAACFSTGQVIGLSTSTFSKGTLSSLGSAPQSLAVFNGKLLSVDGFDRRLYQASITSAGISQTSSATSVGAVATQVIVDGTVSYVVNAGTGTLQVLRLGADAGVITLDAGVSGLPLGTIAELNFGMNSFPEGAAKVGDFVWVPLNGGTGDAADAGGMVVKVSVTDPSSPSEVSRVDLRSLDLHPFDGGSTVARPWAIVARGGALYVVLNNLNATSFVPEGPGLLARIDPTTSAVTVLGLGGKSCLNPQWAQSVGGKLAVSCAGKAQYDTNFDVVSVEGAGLAVLDEADQLVASWSSACPDAGVACPPMTPGRFAVSGQRVLLGDQNTGRIVVLDVSDAGVSEVRGLNNAVTTCPGRNVADLVTLP